MSTYFSKVTLIHIVKQKNGILGKLRNNLPSDILKNVCYCLFDTHLCYACQVWGHSDSELFVMVQRAQNKALRIINLNEERHPNVHIDTLRQRYLVSLI